MREAIRRPPRDGVLDHLIEVCLVLLLCLLGSEAWNLRLPLLNPPQATCAFRLAEALGASAVLLGACYPKKSRSKRPPKNDQILMPYQHRFWSVFAPFLEAKIAPKSIKNLSNFGFRAFLFRHRFLYRFWSIFGPNFGPRKPKNHWNSVGFYRFFWF